jgi:transposase
MKIATVGIDLAKNVFQVRGIDEHGKAVVKKQLRRDQIATFFVNLPPCLIGMEACGSAHHWARKLQSFGHTVRLMAPQFVKPYVRTNKNDAAAAEAICEAVGRPNMRYVPLKNIEQQAVVALLTLPLLDVLHSHSTTRLCLAGPRARSSQTSSG